MEIWAEGTPVPMPEGRTGLQGLGVCRTSIVMGAHGAGGAALREKDEAGPLRASGFGRTQEPSQHLGPSTDVI